MLPFYQDEDLPLHDRVEDLLSRMTLAEKVGQMLQLDAREGVDDLVLLKLAGSLLHTSPKNMHKAREAVLRTRLQIPLLMADDCIHGHSFWSGATIFPTQLGMASTWDPELIERGARAAAIEIASTGIHWTFSPVLCISRDLRWGRVNETFGEDPYLIGELGAAMIRGYQGDGLLDSTAILATAKHYAGYSETQGGRDASEADLSRRKLRSWFLPPFRRSVDAGCRTFMLGYQAIEGVPVTINNWLINDVLKGEWGFSGTLVTDWDNVGRLVWEQQVCADDVEAAVRAVQSGNDFVMTTPQFFDAAQRAVRAGLLDEKLIDAAVRRILWLKFELGLFENPRLPNTTTQKRVIGCDEHSAVNLEMSRRSLVLLQNDGTLPLEGGLRRDKDGAGLSKSGRPRRIAIIGPNADDPNAQLGDWAGASGQIDWMPDGHPRHLVSTVLDGFRLASPLEWDVMYARGAEIGTLEPDPAGATFPDGQPRPHLFRAASDDEALLAQAVTAASDADWTVVVLGDTVDLTGEGRSTATLELQGGQAELLRRIHATGTPTILVLIQSKPSVLPPVAEEVSAIIQAFNPGMQGGRAIAELILGLIEPSGRLPISIPRHVGQLPVYYNQIRGQHGDRYADMPQQPQFAFGEGLSYSAVEYSGLSIEYSSLREAQQLVASVTVTNNGDRVAIETVQAYVADKITSVTWAEKELKYFSQVELQPGTSERVPILIDISSLALVDASGIRRVEPGTFELQVGNSSRSCDQLTAEFVVIR